MIAIIPMALFGLYFLIATHLMFNTDNMVYYLMFASLMSLVLSALSVFLWETAPRSRTLIILLLQTTYMLPVMRVFTFKKSCGNSPSFMWEMKATPCSPALNLYEK